MRGVCSGGGGRVSLGKTGISGSLTDICLPSTNTILIVEERKKTKGKRSAIEAVRS